MTKRGKHCGKRRVLLSLCFQKAVYMRERVKHFPSYNKYAEDEFEKPYLTLKPYVVGTQKNCLSETILLSAHNIRFSGVMKEIWMGKDLFTPTCLVP